MVNDEYLTIFCRITRSYSTVVIAMSVCVADDVVEHRHFSLLLFRIILNSFGRSAAYKFLR